MISDYIKSHKGALFQLGVGVTECALAYTIMPDAKDYSLSYVLQEAAYSTLLGLGLIGNIALGMARFVPDSNMDSETFSTFETKVIDLFNNEINNTKS